ncbi:hypothetical protein EB796_002272 [Bugula neritina]|uniref:Uncharacterized protein n=1 Tax=Bugula neritina TaxID=10212 RepID=A0A7J7KML7_BUGNE|nr:hypothetical protein EB796_002272 [Bugula neritina]
MPLMTVLQETHVVGFHLVNGVVVQFQMQCVAVMMYTAVRTVTLVRLELASVQEVCIYNMVLYSFDMKV